MHIFGYLVRGDSVSNGHLVMVHPEYAPIIDSQMFAVEDVTLGDTSLILVYKGDVFFLDKELK